jgi:hypothetical protein
LSYRISELANKPDSPLFIYRYNGDCVIVIDDIEFYCSTIWETNLILADVKGAALID